MFKLVIAAILATSTYGQQPSTVPAAQANTASVQRTSGSSNLRLRQPAHQPASQPAFHYDSLLNEEESSNQPREPYNFGYDVRDDYGNHQYRKEESDAQGNVRGSYGYTDANGVFRVVDYVADVHGFRASIRSNEPGIGNAQAANILLNAEQPPQSLLIPTGPLPVAPRPVFPAREPRNRGFTSFDINHAAASSEQVVRNERLRYSFPLPSGAVPAAVDSEQPTASALPSAISTTSPPLTYHTGHFAERIRGSADNKKNANERNRQ